MKYGLISAIFVCFILAFTDFGVPKVLGGNFNVSHEYGLTFDPFDRADINQFVLSYLRRLAQVPCLDIAATWPGIYAKLPGKTEFIAHPEVGVTIVNGLSGAGMTLSFGLGEEIILQKLE